MKRKITLIKPIAMICLAFCLACTEDDDLPPLLVNFTNTEGGLSAETTSTAVEIIFSRSMEEAGTLDVIVSSNTLDYGTDADYYTEPQAVDGIISLPFAVEDGSVSFTVSKGTALNIEADQQLVFRLLSPADTEATFALGQNLSFDLVFSENFIADDGLIELDAGGSEFTHQAFVDLSKRNQTIVDKQSWDLGFHNGEEHRVVLNSSAFVMARRIEKNDLNAVTAEDTVGFSGQMAVPQFDPSIGAVAWIDNTAGDLSKTAFGTIHAADADNKVFIIKRDSSNWKKVRVLQDGTGYTLQVADIGSSNFSTITISKGDTHNFQFVNLDDGEVAVEPEKDSWDIAYGTYTVALSFGPETFIPYGFKDYIVINRHNTSVSEVLIEGGISYESFTASDQEGIDFESEINAIGSSWRNGGGPGQAPSLKEDRFYLIKDSQENIYKLRFNRLTSVTGKRGYPEFTYELL